MAVAPCLPLNRSALIQQGAPRPRPALQSPQVRACCPRGAAGGRQPSAAGLRRNRRSGGLACRAGLLPSPADVVGSVADAACAVCSLSGLASLVGWAMGAGSLALFAPILLRMVRKRSAAGLSITTWMLQMAAFTGSTLYNASRGHPLSTYAEVRTLGDAPAATVILLCAIAEPAPPPARQRF